MIIGLTGFKGNGKTTTARSLKSELGGTWEVYSFADPIRDICQNVFGLSLEQCMDRDKKKELDSFWNMSPRQILGKVGMMFRDHFHEDFWVWVMQRRLQEKPDNHIIIDDVRFQNEARWIKQERDGIIFGLLDMAEGLKSPEDITSRTERQMAKHWEEITDYTITHNFNGPHRVANEILQIIEES